MPARTSRGIVVDSLSEVLALLDVRVALPSRFEAGGHWSLAFKLTEQIKVGALLAGRCWVMAEGGSPTLLEAGDCYLLASGRPYVVASDPDLEPSDGHAVF